MNKYERDRLAAAMAIVIDVMKLSLTGQLAEGADACNQRDVARLTGLLMEQMPKHLRKECATHLGNGFMSLLEIMAICKAAYDVEQEHAKPGDDNP